MVWRVAIACLALAGTLIACTREADTQREEFVKEFVSSVYDDTGMYKRYLVPEHRSEIGELRKRMSKEFRIDRVDRSGFGPYEYYIAFENGTTGVVYVSERQEAVREVGFHVYPR